MPYKIIKKKNDGYFVINKETGRRMNKKPHKTLREATKHLYALRMNVKD